jgi:hypothetical protein
MKFKISKWNNFMQFYYDEKVMEFEDHNAAWQYCRDEDKQTGLIYHHEFIDETKPEVIPTGTFRTAIRITTCKRSTGNEGDTYKTFLLWNGEDVSKIPKPPSSGLWTFKRSRVKVVWDGKSWREVGNKVKPK